MRHTKSSGSSCQAPLAAVSALRAADRVWRDMVAGLRSERGDAEEAGQAQPGRQRGSSELPRRRRPDSASGGSGGDSQPATHVLKVAIALGKPDQAIRSSSRRGAACQPRVWRCEWATGERWLAKRLVKCSRQLSSALVGDSSSVLMPSTTAPPRGLRRCCRCMSSTQGHHTGRLCTRKRLLQL